MIFGKHCSSYYDCLSCVASNCRWMELRLGGANCTSFVGPVPSSHYDIHPGEDYLCPNYSSFIPQEIDENSSNVGRPPWINYAYVLQIILGLMVIFVVLLRTLRVCFPSRANINLVVPSN